MWFVEAPHGHSDFRLKELAIIGVNSDIVVHTLIKSTTSYRTLNEDEKKQVDYLISNHHGIEWDNGYMDPYDALDMLRSTLEDASTVYIKGSERAEYLEEQLQGLYIDIIDLDGIGSPKAHHWPPRNTRNSSSSKAELSIELSLTCPYQLHKHLGNVVYSWDYKCALKLALTYRDSLRKNESGDVAFGCGEGR